MLVLAIGNVGNFWIIMQESVSVRAIAWAVYYICIIRYSYDLRLKNVVYQCHASFIV